MHARTSDRRLHVPVPEVLPTSRAVEPADGRSAGSLRPSGEGEEHHVPLPAAPATMCGGGNSQHVLRVRAARRRPTRPLPDCAVGS